MTLRIRKTAGKIIVNFTDEKFVDDELIQEVSMELMDVCKQAAATGDRLVVDFSELKFMSSAMIGQLVLLNKEAKQHSVDLRFINLRREIHEVIKILRLDKVFRMDDDD